MNLPMDALGLAEPHSGLNAVCVDSSIREEIKVNLRIEGRGYQFI